MRASVAMRFGSDQMPKRRSDKDDPARSRQPRIPKRELERLREQAEAEMPAPSRLERAVLEASGEVGYQNLTVQLVLDRAEVGRSAFYKLFRNKEECYQRAYSVAIDGLAQRLLGACGEHDAWRPGFAAALRELARFVEQEPLLANGVLAQVRVAGGPAYAKRVEVFERLSRAIDSARRETSSSRHSPPPISAVFILSVIEEAVVSSLARRVPAEFAAAVPDLNYLAVSIFFGETEARKTLNG
jgi:AcrR family transcriptional regulator